MNEFQEPDAAARQKAMLIFLLAAVVGSGLVWLLQSRQDSMAEWLADNVDWLLENRWIPLSFMYALMLPAIGGCAYIYHFGSRVLHTQRFPPNGMAVTRRTRILSGQQAVRRARVLQVLSVLLLLTCLAFPLVIYAVLVSVTAAA